MYLSSRNARGKIYLEPQAEPKNYAAFAAGSGITPVISLKSVLKNEPKSSLYWFTETKPEETIFHHTILQPM
jgi:ring-1,2-phenylacetyl-CoA epoxidase subunit PaaE